MSLGEIVGQYDDIIGATSIKMNHDYHLKMLLIFIKMIILIINSLPEKEKLLISINMILIKINSLPESEWFTLHYIICGQT